MSRKILLPGALLMAAVLASTPSLAVEVNSSVQGIVTKSGGDPVVDAEVQLRSPSIGANKTILTDVLGRYHFSTLPPGEYKITVFHPTYRSVEHDGILVLFSTAVDLNLELTSKDSPPPEGQSFSQSPLDFAATQSGVTLSHDALENIPSQRTISDIANFAPGVINSNGLHIHGGFATANQVYIDGLNTVDPLDNTSSISINYDAIEAIEVITGGLDAEYGQTLGGVVNVLTKSGTNEWETTAQVTVSNAHMVVAPELTGDDFTDFSSSQIGLGVGGPILPDRAWFYASVQGSTRSQTTSVDPDSFGRDFETYPMAPERWSSFSYYSKVTAEPGTRHKLTWALSVDPSKHINILQDPYVLPSAEAVEQGGGWLTSLSHQWQLADNALLESALSTQKTKTDITPVLWLDCLSQSDDGTCEDDLSNRGYMGVPITDSWQPYQNGEYASGLNPFTTFSTRKRTHLDVALSNWFSLLGRHHTKIGLQVDLLSSSYQYPTASNAGVTYYGYNDGDNDDTNDDYTDLGSYDPIVQERSNGDPNREYSGTTLSWYLQDTYQPNDKLTLRPGVRFDAPSLTNENGDVAYKAFTIAPRLGAAYKISDSGNAVIHAHYGRFYDTGPMMLSQLLQNSPASVSGYTWNSAAGTWSEEAAYTSSPNTIAHTDLQTPYSDELQLGYTRQLNANWTLRTVAVYEAASRFWEDDEINLIWNSDGTEVLGYRNGIEEAIYRLRTPDELYTHYGSLELSLQRRFSENFALLGSYTYSQSSGTNSSDLATSAMDISTLRQFEDGLLAYDVPHNFKLTGSFEKPDSITAGPVRMGYVLGWNLGLRSGLTYRQQSWNNHSEYGQYTYGASNDGTYRLPAYAQTDVRAGFTFGGTEKRMMFGIDIYNLFNDRAVTEVDTTFDHTAVGSDQTFGEMLGRQAPRTISVIARGEF